MEHTDEQGDRRAVSTGAQNRRLAGTDGRNGGSGVPTTVRSGKNPGPPRPGTKYLVQVEIQVDIQARKLFLEFSDWTLTHMRALIVLRPGFWTEIRAVLSSRVIRPGEHF